MSQAIESPNTHCSHGIGREHAHKHAHHPEALEVVIVCNGAPKTFRARANELVKKLLTEALHEFHVVNNPHTYGLYNAAGAELPSVSVTREANRPD